MQNNFDLQAYITGGVERIVSEVIRASRKDPKESAFLFRFAAAARRASKKRALSEETGEHIPAFLICSITSQCNLHCAGCYSRCNQGTVDEQPTAQLTGADWASVFDQAKEAGISFIFLLGGEPLLRRDVIEEASKRPDILFPVFTNGTYFDEAYLDLFSNCRNLVPVMSMEGNEEITDVRRGHGVYEQLMKNMSALQNRYLLYGVSITVTTGNIHEVTSDSFADKLALQGCKVVFFIEYVPMDGASLHLAPGDTERAYLADRLTVLRRERPETVFIAFPGDETSSGGCLAAGRGFFHINSHGGAEPCPASPYSDINVRETSLLEALRSPLFTSLRSGQILTDDHNGGCVLYENRHLVEAIMTYNHR